MVLPKMKILTVIGILIAVAEISQAQFCEKNNDNPWSYHGSTNGPKQWVKLFPKCGGKQQSPIRIEVDRIHRNISLSKLIFLRYDVPVDRAEIVNNGHTVLITPRDGVRRGICIGGETFTLQQMHFHWGSVDKPGAEHTINNIRYPMEIHFVHKNAKNNIAVVALFVKANLRHNDAFTPIIEALTEAMHKEDSTYLLYLLDLNRLFPENPASFYRYMGSFTTPPCDEGVIWSILRKPTFIGRHQLDLFLNLYSVPRKDRSPECNLSENYRPAFAAREVSASS